MLSLYFVFHASRYFVLLSVFCNAFSTSGQFKGHLTVGIKFDFLNLFSLLCLCLSRHVILSSQFILPETVFLQLPCEYQGLCFLE